VILAAEELSVRYPGAKASALDRVTLTIPAGSLTAVIGPNGSGKSTLLRALLGVIAPSAGRATVDGTDARAWNRRELARLIGVVAQSETIAFPITAREMVAMGRYPHLGPLRAEGLPDREAIARALARCDVAEFADRHVTALSGGELQRVRIARALAQEPRVLALDEPTVSLDVAHEMTIMGLLRGWASAGMTVLLITHQLDLAARFADRIVLLDRGRVAAEGTPTEVFRADVMEKVYEWPLRVDADPVTGAPRVVPLDAPGRRHTPSSPAG
jgi:iron complex transport system ATP-binding protein